MCETTAIKDGRSAPDEVFGVPLSADASFVLFGDAGVGKKHLAFRLDSRLKG
jgi:DNA replication protein DnaC